MNKLEKLEITLTKAVSEYKDQQDKVNSLSTEVSDGEIALFEDIPLETVQKVLGAKDKIIKQREVQIEDAKQTLDLAKVRVQQLCEQMVLEGASEVDSLDLPDVGKVTFAKKTTVSLGEDVNTTDPNTLTSIVNLVSKCNLTKYLTLPFGYRGFSALAKQIDKGNIADDLLDEVKQLGLDISSTMEYTVKLAK